MAAMIASNSNSAAACAVFWDLENIRVPRRVSASKASNAISVAIRETGYVRDIVHKRCYYDSRHIMERNTDRTAIDMGGWTLCDCPKRNQKETLDKKIIVDVMAFAAEHRHLDTPPTIVLISSDGDFAYMLAILRDWRMKVVLIYEQATDILLTSADVALNWRNEVLHELQPSYRPRDLLPAPGGDLANEVCVQFLQQVEAALRDAGGRMRAREVFAEIQVPPALSRSPEIAHSLVDCDPRMRTSFDGTSFVYELREDSNETGGGQQMLLQQQQQEGWEQVQHQHQLPQFLASVVDMQEERKEGESDGDSGDGLAALSLSAPLFSRTRSTYAECNAAAGEGKYQAFLSAVFHASISEAADGSPTAWAKDANVMTNWYKTQPLANTPAQRAARKVRGCGLRAEAFRCGLVQLGFYDRNEQVQATDKLDDNGKVVKPVWIHSSKVHMWIRLTEDGIAHLHGDQQ